MKLKDIAYIIHDGLFYLKIMEKDTLMYTLKEVWTSDFNNIIRRYGEYKVYGLATIEGYISIALYKEN